MPCLLEKCNIEYEIFRFSMAFLGIYIYHYVMKKCIIHPFVSDYLIKKRNLLKPDKYDKCCESIWKNISVLSFFIYGLHIAAGEPWFLSKEGYFNEWGTKANVANEPLRWYYMIYASFWLQSIDFLLSLSNNYYKIKRKDNVEMLIHHFATLSLIAFSYLFDFTRIGVCVLMIHDVNDLLLETAKFFVYLESETIANLFFGTFAVVWFILRWGFYTYNIIFSAYYYAYENLVLKIYKRGGLTFGFTPDFYYKLWFGFVSVLILLLVLHIYWGYLIVLMVLKALNKGNVEKDIRSDSENEDESDNKNNMNQTEPTSESFKNSPIIKNRKKNTPRIK